jgi:hypothetical protein
MNDSLWQKIRNHAAPTQDKVWHTFLICIYLEKQWFNGTENEAKADDV